MGTAQAIDVSIKIVCLSTPIENSIDMGKYFKFKFFNIPQLISDRFKIDTTDTLPVLYLRQQLIARYGMPLLPVTEEVS